MLKKFCLIHLTKHQQILREEINNIINDYNQFKQRINQQKQNHSLIKQIDQWERNTIEKIQEKAKEYREIVTESSQIWFNDFSEQIEQIHEKNKYNEINLSNKVIEITEELNNLSNISVKEDSQSFINEISIILSKKSKFNKWKQNAIIVAAENGRGQELNQLNSTGVIFIDKNKNIFTADCFNHRIVEWKYNAKEGQIIAGGNGKENEVRQWKIGEYNEGIVVAGGNGKGDQLNTPDLIFVDKDQSVYVSDKDNHRVMKWRKDAKEGRIVAGGNDQGKNLNQLSSSDGVIVESLGQIYIIDWGITRVMRWCEGKEEGNLYVADWGNNQIAKFGTIL
ncbi:unnamed protein product [Adineta steineri]|uniref:NHL repeat containing protein n=2 Tax=Adineta steineri TaxID=433720 RepID=A0A818YGZ4_9BILA|nr:unnamed protein product [Adineta steineri]